MDVELLVVPDCPNEDAASPLLRTALNDVALTQTVIRTTVIDSQQEADAHGFVGSATMLIDGADPLAEPGQALALACRAYLTRTGLAGVSPLNQLRETPTPAAGPHSPGRIQS